MGHAVRADDDALCRDPLQAFVVEEPKHSCAERPVPFVRPADLTCDHERHARDLSIGQYRTRRSQEIGVGIVKGHEDRARGQALPSVESLQHRLQGDEPASMAGESVELLGEAARSHAVVLQDAIAAQVGNCVVREDDRLSVS